MLGMAIKLLTLADDQFCKMYDNYVTKDKLPCKSRYYHCISNWNRITVTQNMKQRQI